MEEITTRREFDRFERRLKARRFGLVAFTLLLLVGGAYVFWWGVVQAGFVRSETESEPNDTPQQADRVFLEQSIRGFIGPPGTGERADDDFYLLQNDTRGPITLRVELTGVPGLDLVLKAYDADARELLMINSGDEGEGELLPNMFLSGHYAYLQVREYWVRNRPARYNANDPYHLTVDYRDPLPGEEVEPNGRVTDALQTRANEVYLGFVGWAGDVDLYRAPELPTSGTMVTVTAEGAGELDLELRFYDAAANELWRSNRSPGSATERATLFAAPQGHGALYVGVAAADERAREPELPYRVSLSLSPVAPLEPPL